MRTSSLCFSDVKPFHRPFYISQSSNERCNAVNHKGEQGRVLETPLQPIRHYICRQISHEPQSPTHASTRGSVLSRRRNPPPGGPSRAPLPPQRLDLWSSSGGQQLTIADAFTCGTLRNAAPCPGKSVPKRGGGRSEKKCSEKKTFRCSVSSSSTDVEMSMLHPGFAEELPN